MNGIALKAGPRSVNVWWAPHYHDFGLISGFLEVCFHGCSAIVCSPLDFIQRPPLWLDMISSFNGTHTFGPDFAYLLLVRKTSAQERNSGKWRLDTLNVAMSAAERCRVPTINAFCDAFCTCGFRREAFCPAYGLAEHTVGVTISPPSKLPTQLIVDREALENLGEIVEAGQSSCRSVALVSVGVPWLDVHIRIIQLDEDDNPVSTLPPDVIGEIWVSSPSKTMGYENLAEKTQNDFFARIPGEGNGDRRYLRTGDLGFISSKSNELFIAGRKKDMIIISGKNHYSEDIELTVATELLDVLRPGCIAAFAIEESESDGEMLAIVAEVRSPKYANTEDMFQRILESVARDHHVNVHAKYSYLRALSQSKQWENSALQG